MWTTRGLRILTGVLPNLLVAGVPKCGTTSLFWYLSQHPEICASDEKGVRYFNPLRDGGALPSLETYKQHFSHYNGEAYAAEGTPSYCYGGRTLLEAIRRVLHNPRIILSLRDPVDRLWSAYTFQRTGGFLRGVSSFEEYVAICVEKRRLDEKQGPAFGGVTISFYGEYLPDWFDLFGDDVRVVFAEDLFSEPVDVVSDLCRWLSIDSEAPASFDYGARNKTMHARNLSLSRSVHALKRRGDHVLKRVPVLRQGLRSAYMRLNTGDLAEKLRPETRARLEVMYEESNSMVASILRQKGYDRLPPWLEKVPA
jgi:hypothetical protein